MLALQSVSGGPHARLLQVVVSPLMQAEALAGQVEGVACVNHWLLLSHGPAFYRPAPPQPSSIRHQGLLSLYLLGWLAAQN